MLEQGKHYRTNNIIALMGSDFDHKPFSSWYPNMDKLIHYVNLDGRINLFYSTPSLYIQSVHNAKANWTDTLKTGSFFF